MTEREPPPEPLSEPDLEFDLPVAEPAREPEPEPEVAAEPPAEGEQPKKRRFSGETVKRILWALPWAVFAIFIIVVGGPLFAAAMLGLGYIGLREYFDMTTAARPLPPPAFIALAAMIVAAYSGETYHVLYAALLVFPLVFLFAAARDNQDNVTYSVAITVLGLTWIGMGFAHATLLRELPNHGAALMVDVLVATIACDTAAYAAGRMFGSRKLSPRISPNKTVEGLIGGIIGGIMGFWLAGLYQDWLSGADALMMGAAVAVLAPIGDLFASMIKRDCDVKDTGKLFGPHGGLIDRLDAVLFTIVATYYLSVALVY